MVMMSSEERESHRLFIQALQKEPIECARPECRGPVKVEDLSQVQDRIKTFGLKCEQCDWHYRMTGREQLHPSWDDTALLEMAYEHLMHQPALCSYDQTPIIFSSLPNPRRRARYRLSCYYCGRQAEMDWPPQDLRR